jgi:nucleoid-associated protein YgaU
MRITKLHLILIAIAILVIGIYAFQIHEERQRVRMVQEIELARQAERKRFEEELRRRNEAAKAKEQAVQAVAVAGEYWRIARQEGRAVAQGQQTLRQAKECLAQDDYAKAAELARQSIAELKEAPVVSVPVQRNLYYTVRRGDSLWTIARDSRHYGRGALWPKIWRANEKKIPDFDVIHPRQVLLIPKQNTREKAKA